MTIHAAFCAIEAIWPRAIKGLPNSQDRGCFVLWIGQLVCYYYQTMIPYREIVKVEFPLPLKSFPAPSVSSLIRSGVGGRTAFQFAWIENCLIVTK